MSIVTDARSRAYSSAVATNEEAERLYSRVSRRIIPFLFICYVFAYLDRVNIGFAAIEMKQDLNFSDAVYGLGAGMFFLGYFLFEVPSNLLLMKIGARKTLTRIMVVWGLISASFMFVHTPMQFYVARFFLGAFEAGFFPGVVLYLTFWFPPTRRGKIIAMFMSAIAVAGIIGGPLSGWLMSNMEGKMGLAGWQWMFVVEAMPSIVLGLCTFLVLADSPAKAPWLTSREREIIANALTESHISNEHSFDKAIRDPRSACLPPCLRVLHDRPRRLLHYVLASNDVKGFGVKSSAEIGMLTAIPYVVAAVTMIVISKHSDKVNERRWHTAMCMVVGAIGFVAATMFTANLPAALCAMTVATIGMFAVMPVFWTIPTAYLSGTAAAGGIGHLSHDAAWPIRCRRRESAPNKPDNRWSLAAATTVASPTARPPNVTYLALCNRKGPYQLA